MTTPYTDSWELHTPQHSAPPFTAASIIRADGAAHVVTHLPPIPGGPHGATGYWLAGVYTTSEAPAIHLEDGHGLDVDDARALARALLSAAALIEHRGHIPPTTQGDTR